MTLEEAIQHCEEVAAGLTKQGECAECAAEHRQLAEWLKELSTKRGSELKIFRGPFTVMFKAEECMEPEDFDDGYCFISDNGVICIHRYVEGVTDPSPDTMVRIYSWDTLIGVIN